MECRSHLSVHAFFEPGQAFDTSYAVQDHRDSTSGSREHVSNNVQLAARASVIEPKSLDVSQYCNGTNAVVAGTDRFSAVGLWWEQSDTSFSTFLMINSLHYYSATPSGGGVLLGSCRDGRLEPWIGKRC
jgi:hypothetical protein